MKFKRILLIGDKGQLGKEFSEYFNLNNIEFIGYDIDKLDVSNFNSIKDIFSSYHPDLVINCSAYTLVDNAEKDYESAYQANAIGAKNLALLCNEFNSFFVHYSTDYVFDGKNNITYTEANKPNPINNYGKTKLLGEEYIQSIFSNYLILRLSWVYGNGSQNFIFKFRDWASKNNSLNISDDEISVPTSTKFVVENTIKSLDLGIMGLFHLVPYGYCSRYEWAEEIKKKFNIETEIKKISKSEFNLPAERPTFSALNSQKIQDLLKVDFKNWKDYF